MAHSRICHCLLLHEHNNPNLMAHINILYDIPRYHICQQVAAISSTWTTHAWTNLYTETMSWRLWVCFNMALTWNRPAQPPSWPFILNLYCLSATCHWWSTAAQTKSKLPCMLQLQSCPLHSGNSPSPMSSIFVNKFAHLKFTVYGRKHTHICAINAVHTSPYLLAMLVLLMRPI